MDLKEVKKGKLWILHLIDSATRFTAACLISNKKKETVVCRIFQLWIAYFGAPMKFHSDCGGEFCNAVFLEMNEKLGVKTSTTPAEAPFSNGIVERSNVVLYESMMKTVEDCKCGMDTALAWAVAAKNALQNVSGYSPNQLVFGSNVNLPSVISDLPPALESTTSSDIVRENLNALHKARKNFIEAESSEKIRRALRAQTRTYSEEVFEPGEEVYYKRNKSKGWHGPSKVMGKEGNFVLIRHGKFFERRHPCHLMKVSVDYSKVNDCEKKSGKSVLNKTSTVVRRNSINVSDSESDVDSSDDERGHTQDADNIRSQAEDESDDSEGVEGVENLPGDGPDISTGVQCDTVTAESNDVVRLEDSSGDRSDTSVVPEYDENTEPYEDTESADVLDATTRPKPETFIRYKLKDGGVEGLAKILSCQPKRTGSSKNWLNVLTVDSDEPSSINWDHVEWWKEEECERVLCLSSIKEKSQDVMDAKMKEVQNLKENSVFVWVDDHGQEAVTCKWVFTEKEKEGGTKVLKARLVARGFEEKQFTKRTDSPTCSRQSLRMVFIVSSSMGWEINSLDITSAFLQGNDIDREVFIQPPPEISEEGKLWKLRRCLYGLNDAPREWYNRVYMEVKKLGGTASKYDNALFLWHDESGSLLGIFVSHVDDFVYGGTDSWHSRVIDELLSIFKISKQEKGSFKYIGLNVMQNGEAVFIDQNEYVKSLEPVSITNERKLQKDETLTYDEKSALRSISGQLLWITSQTRPDAAFDSCYISNFGKEPRVRNLIEANKAIKRIKACNLKLVFPDLGNPEFWKIVVYADATHASLPSGASQGAFIVFVCGNGRTAPVVWRSKKLDRVTKSPLASETMALAEAADAGYLVSALVNEIFGMKKGLKVICKTDSKSLVEHLESSRIIQDLRLRVDIARLREMVKMEEIVVQWVDGTNQLADALTKYGASTARLTEVLKNGRFVK